MVPNKIITPKFYHQSNEFYKSSDLLLKTCAGSHQIMKLLVLCLKSDETLNNEQNIEILSSWTSIEAKLSLIFKKDLHIRLINL